MVLESRISLSESVVFHGPIPMTGGKAVNHAEA